MTELFVLFSIQQIPGFTPELFGGRPFLIIPLFISISMFEGSYLGIAWGFLTGLLLDLSFNGGIKVQIMAMGIIGYLLGKVKNRFPNVTMIKFLVLSLFCQPFLIWFGFYTRYVIKGLEYANIAFYRHVVPSIIYTLILSPLIYLFNRPIWFFVSQKEGD